MGDRKRRSKKRSSSNKQRPLKGFTLYLCHCVDYDEVAEALQHGGIRFKRHRDYFPGYAPDTDLLKLVGQKHWILITGDKKQRIKPLEIQAIKQFRVREFVIGGGNIGARLVNARRKIRNLCRNNAGPFIAAVLPSGNVRLRSLDGEHKEEGSPIPLARAAGRSN
jgi:PIN like domain